MGRLVSSVRWRRARRSSLGMDLPPMLGNFPPGADPNAVAGGDVIEKLDQPGHPAGTPGQPVVQRQRHQLRMFGAYSYRSFSKTRTSQTPIELTLSPSVSAPASSCAPRHAAIDLQPPSVM